MTDQMLQAINQFLDDFCAEFEVEPCRIDIQTRVSTKRLISQAKDSNGHLQTVYTHKAKLGYNEHFWLHASFGEDRQLTLTAEVK